MSSEMIKPKVRAIAAIGKNRELGKRGAEKMLWHIPEDLQRFKELTVGKPVIMGSSTFESLGKPLPGRLNIVLSHDADYVADGCEIAHSLEDAVSLAAGSESQEVFIIGGGFVYKQALESGIVDKLDLTIIDADFPEADVIFPEYEHAFSSTGEEVESKDEHFAYKFVTLERNDNDRKDN